MISLLTAEEIYTEAARRGSKPDPMLLVSEWSDQHRILTTRSSPEPGNWRTSRTPYLKGIMDALSPSDRTEFVIFMAGAQIGKTECGNNWVGYNIHLAPGPMLMVQPTTDMAKRNSKQRIGPLIEDCPALRSLVREARSRDGGNTVLAKEFPGGILVMTGANSAKGLRSMPCRYLFLDEVDGFLGDVDGEGEPCDLAITRTNNFARRKIFITSTPTLQGRSRIENYFSLTDQCFYFVPCIYCGRMQTLRIEQLVWKRGEPETALYHCESCGRGMPDHAKNTILPRGQWRATAKGDARMRGFQLNSLYSPVGWLSWEQVARKHDQAGKDPEKRQVFCNTILGRPWQDEGEVPDVDRLYERRESYQIGIVPKGGLILTAGADVQVRRIEVEVVAWGRDKQSWSVDYRVIEGDTSQPQVYDKLAELLDEDFPTVYGQPVRIAKLAVDTGFNTLAVYDFVRKMSPQRVMGIKGDVRTASFVAAPSLIEHGPQGRALRYGVRLWPVNSAIGKEELYRWLRTSVPDHEKGESWPVGFCHFPQYSKEYFEQLCAEQLVSKLVAGYRRTSWEKIRDRNEALDCRIYARAAAASLRIEAYTPARWNELEKTLTLNEPPVMKPASAKKTGVESREKSPVPKFTSFKAGDSFLE